MLPKKGHVRIKEVLDCLNNYRLRATYQAVGEVIGTHWRNVGPHYLKKASPRTSWVVNKATGRPSDDVYGHQPLIVHPVLERSDHVICGLRRTARLHHRPQDQASATMTPTQHSDPQRRLNTDPTSLFGSRLGMVAPSGSVVGIFAINTV